MLSTYNLHFLKFILIFMFPVGFISIATGQTPNNLPTPQPKTLLGSSVQTNCNDYPLTEPCFADNDVINFATQAVFITCYMDYFSYKNSAANAARYFTINGW